MASLPRPAVFLDILEEHLEELDFLWSQRESVIFAPDWTLSDLAALEERAEAHLDGLRIGAGHSVDLARAKLSGDEKWAAAASALTMMAMGSADLETEVVMALSTAGEKARDGIRIALRHSDVRRVADNLTQIASSGEPAVRAAAADVLAFHRLPAPTRLVELFGAPDPAVRCLAYGAAGRFGGPWSIDQAESALAVDDSPLRNAALAASARLGLPGLAALCRKAAQRHAAPVPEAVTFLGVLGELQDLQLLESHAVSGPEIPTGIALAAIQGLGAMGHVQAIPTLLKAMNDPKLTHAAGAAFVRISGAEKIQADAPLPPPVDLSEDERDFWDDTKPPDPERAKSWWEKQKGRFAPDGRWQTGMQVPRQGHGPGFDLLPLEVRRDLHFSARSRDPIGVPDLELEARAALQSAAPPRVIPPSP